MYGYPAIAAAIDLRCYFDCHFIRRVGGENQHPRTVNFQFADFDNLFCELLLPEVEKFSDATCDQLREMSSQFSPDLNEKLNRLPKATTLKQSISVLNYVLLRCLQKNQPLKCNFGPYLSNSELQITVTVRSEIPIGAGLGSSAAFSVAAATCFELLVGSLPLTFPLTLNADQCDSIRKLAHEAEVIVHGSPSGIDTATSVQGGAVWFKRSGDGGCSIHPVSALPACHFPLLIVDSRVNRSTGDAVRMVARAHSQDPIKTGQLLEFIGKLTDQAHHELTSLNSPTDMTILASLVDRNQKALHALGVSSATLDRIVNLLSEFGLSSKITGAGIGGCVIGVSRSMDMSTLQRAAEYMCHAGFPATLVCAFSKGVFVSHE